MESHRQKTRNLMAGPRATLLVPDPASEYRTVELPGDVEIVPDDGYSFARQVGQKYGGPTSATPTARASPGSGSS